MELKKIRFKTDIYNKEAIEKSIEAFVEAADFDILEENGYFVVIVSNMVDEVADILEDEFCNYALYLMRLLENE